MQNTLEKNKTKTSIDIKEKNILKLNDIVKFYQNNNTIEKFGLEYERLSLDKKTFKNASYDTVKKIIIDFSNILNWEIVYDNDTVIGTKDNHGNSVSLEPGCQMEISLPPLSNVFDIDLNLTKYVNLLDKIADIYNVIFLGYGISPMSNADNIELLNKRRYIIMNDYLPNCSYGELCPKMMRQTAGIQINVDYKNALDAYLKLEFLNKIIPFVSALFSNSPIENNTLTNFKSKRAQIWLFTGKDRCNLFYKNIFKGFNKKKNVFNNYIKSVLDVPMIFIQRNNTLIPIEGKINFNQYLKDGFRGHYASIEDYILHASLCFPDIRLKKCIEIRNHDSADISSALALCAFYKGLLNNDIEDLIKQFSYLKINKIEEYSKSAVSNGLDFKIDNTIWGWDVIAKLYKISLNSLSTKERSYLTPIFNMIVKRKTKSDILIDYGFKKAADVVEFYLGIK